MYMYTRTRTHARTHASRTQEKRRVSREEGEAYAAQQKILFVETSAKAGLNVKALFRQLAQKLPGPGIEPFVCVWARASACVCACLCVCICLSSPFAVTCIPRSLQKSCIIDA